MVPGSFAANKPTPIFHLILGYIKLRGAYGLDPLTYNLFLSRSQYHTDQADESDSPLFSS